MTHHPGIHSARHLFEKLTRELARLEQEGSPDNFANLVITAYSICDWISNDPSVPASARDALPAIRRDPWLLACRDLANGTKHFRLNYPNTVVVDATCVTAFGMGRYGAGPFGLNEERNRYVHSAWGIAHKDTGHRRFKRSARAKSGFQLDLQNVPPADILDLAERLRQAEHKLWEIVP